MKILVVPDIHENLQFLDGIRVAEDLEAFDRVVLLGDYFDPRGDVVSGSRHLEEVSQTLVQWKDLLGERLLMLCGNHDLPYYALRPACRGDWAKANRFIGEWLAETTLERARVINSVWDEFMWQELKGAVLLDGWLLSHSGVHPDFWPKDAGTVEKRMEIFDARWNRAMEEIFKVPEDPIFSIGRARGGVAPTGGPLWLDWDAEFEDELEVPQIAGHTRCAKEPQKGRSHCIDFAQSSYALLDDGEFRLRQIASG